MYYVGEKRVQTSCRLQPSKVYNSLIAARSPSSWRAVIPVCGDRRCLIPLRPPACSFQVVEPDAYLSYYNRVTEGNHDYNMIDVLRLGNIILHSAWLRQVSSDAET